MSSVTDRLKARLDSMRESASEAAATIMQTAVIGGVTFGWGVAQSKWGDANLDIKVMGVDAPLLVGVAAHGLAFAGMFGNYDDALHNVGDASLGVWAHGKGLQVGAEWKTTPLFEASGRRVNVSAMLRDRLAAARR